MAVEMDGIKIKVRADTSQAQDDLKKLKDIGNSISSVGTSLIKGVTLPITAAGTACLMTSSNASEMESKFDTVFKNLAGEADKWANQYADAIGRSQYEIKEAISNQADLYQGMGFTADEAFNLSKQVTTLGYDLASFNNVNDAQAIDAMTKALMGETESAKMLGVNLTDTIMETSEFTKATGKSWKELSVAEKAQVRYKEAVKQSKNAIGDAERTSDGFANQMKRLKGNFEELSVEIGKVMLPIATELVTAFGAMTEKVTSLLKDNPILAESIVKIGGALAVLPPILFAIGKAITIFAMAPALFTGLAAGAAIAGVAFLGLNENAQNALDNLTYKISDFCSIFVQKITEMAPIILQEGTVLIAQFITGLTHGIPALLETTFTIVKLLVNTFMNSFPTIINTGFQLVLQLVNGIVGAIPNLSNTILNMCLDMLSWFLSNLPQWVNNGVQVVSNIVSGISSSIPFVIQTVYETLTQMLDTMIQRMPEFLQKGKDTIIKIIEGLKAQLPVLLDNMGQAIMRTLTIIAERMPEFLQKGIQFVSEMIKGIAQNLPAIMGKMGELLGELVAKIVQYLPQFLEKGIEIIAKLIAGLIDGIPKLLSAGKDLANGILDGIGSMLSGFLSIGSKIVSNIKQGVMNAWGNFTSWLSNKVKSIPIVGSFFRMAPTKPQDGQEGDTGEGLPVPYITPRGGVEGPIAEMVNFSTNFNKFRKKENLDLKKNDEGIKENKIEVNLNIKEFNNNRETDIEDLADQLAFLLEQKGVFE